METILLVKSPKEPKQAQLTLFLLNDDMVDFDNVNEPLRQNLAAKFGGKAAKFGAKTRTRMTISLRTLEMLCWMSVIILSIDTMGVFC